MKIRVWKNKSLNLPNKNSNKNEKDMNLNDKTEPTMKN